MRNFLETDFDNAVIELRGFIQAMAANCRKDGWDYMVTENGAESFKELQAVAEDKLIPIADCGSDTSIYQSPAINTMFRFWHDVTHLELGLGFSEKAEQEVAEHHIKQAREYGLSHFAIEMLWADTCGQVKYYYTHKKFIKNQLDFVYAALQVGINKACSRVW